jgi:hypothetical protein
MRRKAVLVSWKLFGQWWCLPVDQTPEEKATFLTGLQHNLGDDFAQCPLAFIEDRLYGGFKCEDANRRHVYFAVAEYSFLQAAEGDFWANHAERRFQTREKLVNNNLDTFIGDGPFTEAVTA